MSHVVNGRQASRLKYGLRRYGTICCAMWCDVLDVLGVRVSLFLLQVSFECLYSSELHRIRTQRYNLDQENARQLDRIASLGNQLHSNAQGQRHATTTHAHRLNEAKAWITFMWAAMSRVRLCACCVLMLFHVLCACVELPTCIVPSSS